MKNVNQLVLAVQSEGFESVAFYDLYNIINSETIEPKANSFRLQLKGQVDCAISDGYDLLFDLTQKWNGTGNFHSLFKTAYTNRLKNMVKYVNRKKRKHETNYDMSLSDFVKGPDEPSSILEVASERQLHCHVNYDASFNEVHSLETLIEMFAEAHPTEAGVINLMIMFTPDTPQAEKTRAYCDYYGVQTYTSVIQKRVSRSREAFKKFLLKNDYPINF